MVARPLWLTSSCSQFDRSMVPRIWSPFHRSSDPNMATGWMQAVMAFLQLAGERPICPASRTSQDRE